jgi:hypothetical protein
MFPVQKTRNGYDPSAPRATSLSVTTSRMNINDGTQNNPSPKLAVEESTVEIQSNGVRAASPTAELSNGLTCGSQVGTPMARPVDRLTITGSTPGDHRAPSRDTAKSAVDRASDNGGPRKPMGQEKISGRTPAPSGFQSFGGAEGSDKN